MRGALKLSGIVRANVRLNISIAMLLFVPGCQSISLGSFRGVCGGRSGPTCRSILELSGHRSLFSVHYAVSADFEALFKARPVQFGALPAAAEQLFTKPRSRPKSEPNFEALSWLFAQEKPQNSYEPGGLLNSLVSGTPKI